MACRDRHCTCGPDRHINEFFCVEIARQSCQSGELFDWLVHQVFSSQRATVLANKLASISWQTEARLSHLDVFRGFFMGWNRLKQYGCGCASAREAAVSETYSDSLKATKAQTIVLGSRPKSRHATKSHGSTIGTQENKSHGCHQKSQHRRQNPMGTLLS